VIMITLPIRPNSNRLEKGVTGIKFWTFWQWNACLYTLYFGWWSPCTTAICRCFSCICICHASFYINNTGNAAVAATTFFAVVDYRCAPHVCGNSTRQAAIGLQLAGDLKAGSQLVFGVIKWFVALPVLGTGYPVVITRVPGPGFNS